MLRTVFNFFGTLICLMMVGCNYNQFDDLEPVNEPLNVNCQLIDLPVGVRIESDMVAQGVVVSSDSTGNFYREVVIQQLDSDFTIALQVNIYDIFAMWRVGMVVGIRFQDLTLAIDNGRLICGIGGSDGTILAIPSLAAGVERVHFQGFYGTATILERDVNSVTDADAGKMVRLDNVYFINQGATFSGSQPLAQVGFEGNITLYTSPYASFARDIVPVGALELTAFVTLNTSGNAQLKCNNAPASTMRQNYSWTQRTDKPKAR